MFFSQRHCVIYFPLRLCKETWVHFIYVQKRLNVRICRFRHAAMAMCSTWNTCCSTELIWAPRMHLETPPCMCVLSTTRYQLFQICSMACVREKWIMWLLLPKLNHRPTKKALKTFAVFIHKRHWSCSDESSSMFCLGSMLVGLVCLYRGIAAILFGHYISIQVCKHLSVCLSSKSCRSSWCAAALNLLGFQCLAQGLLCNAKTCYWPSDLQDSIHVVLRLRVCVCTHMHTGVYLSGSVKQRCPLLGRYLHSVARCDNGLKGEIEEKWSRWECGTKMAKYQGYFSGVAIAAHEYTVSAAIWIKAANWYL